LSDHSANQIRSLKNFARQKTLEYDHFKTQEKETLIRRSSMVSIPSAKHLLDEISLKRDSIIGQVQEEIDENLSMEDLMGDYLADQNEQQAKELFKREDEERGTISGAAVCRFIQQ
jgi:hypothetical protein